MGMSSSQARLLNLTARMHQIEFKAARLEDQKLQLANESDSAYNEYLDALDAKKIQYRALTTAGKIEFKDANMNIMQNRIVPTYTGERSREIFFLQNKDGRIMVTPTVATYYHLSETTPVDPDMNNYVHTITGENMTEIPVYKTEYQPDPNVITSFTPIPNTLISTATSVHSAFTPVANTVGGIDYEALADYAQFNPTPTTVSSSTPEITPATTSLSSGTYTVKNADDLKQLANLSWQPGVSMAGVNIVLDGDIDMSAISGWKGINDFRGEFNGNGHIISNLTGTQGLFDSTNGATIKNVGLENIYVNGNKDYVGGLIGHAVNTNIDTCYTTGTVKNSDNTVDTPDYTQTKGTQNAGTGGLVGGTTVQPGQTVSCHNVYANTAVIASSSNSVGGLLGSVWVDYSGSDFNLDHCYAIGNVQGSLHVGGLIGRTWYDQDNSGRDTDIIKAYAGGDVTGSGNVGGFVGDFLYWGDNHDHCQLTECVATGKVTGGGAAGAFIGRLHIKNASSGNPDYCVNVKDSGYSTISGLGGYGMVEDTNNPNVDVSATYLSTSGSGTLLEFNLAGTVPSIDPTTGEGAYMSNILGVLTKAEVFDACDHSSEDVPAMKAKIAAFLALFNNDNTDNTKLWYLNIKMVDYLNGTSGDGGLANALYQDIMAGTNTNTATYQSGPALTTGNVKRGVGTEWNITGTHIPGVIGTPSINTIAESVYYAMKLLDPTMPTTLSDVKSWFNTKYGALSDTDKITLANINERLNTGVGLGNLYSAIATNGGRVDYTDKWANPHEWTINVSSADQPVDHTTGTSPVQVPDGVRYEWDTSNPAIADAITMWAMAQRGVIIVDESLASSGAYLTNMISNAEAVFTKFDPSKVSEFAGLTSAEIMGMSDEEYNRRLHIENVSIAVETAVDKVIDKKYIKNAESKYEAEMARIDKKDAQYDSLLACLQTERNAVAQEMESLKTVAKENVEMVFNFFV